MDKIYTDSIDQIMTHIICKARGYLQEHTPVKPPRVIVQERRRKALTDVLVASLDSSSLSDQAIARAATHLVAGLEYPEKDTDRDAFVRILTNLSYMLENGDFVITGARKAFDYAIDGMIMKSQVDMMVKNTTTGYIHPAIVDFSSTKYEPYYNPIVYQAQTIVEYLELTGTNTQVLVFTPASDKQWIYEHRKYGAMVHASLREALHERRQEFNGARFGWWCAGCPYRGTCHTLLKEII